MGTSGTDNAGLRKFINLYASFSEKEEEVIEAKFQRRIIKKNDFILREGEICSDFIFVQSGCLRLFYIQDEVEISVWFAFPHSSAIEISSFIRGTPTYYYLQAIEDSEISVLSKSALEKIYKSIPTMEEMMRKFWEDVSLHLIDRFTSLQRDTAEQRYRNLLKTPRFLQAIPQKYLASFIGVTPTSLSRIRKKIGMRP